ncbi:putative CLIP domain-containing serine protease B15, partial [Polypedilum vanderplanki]
PRLKAISSDRTICGESIYGNFICFGDSGHGFFVRFKDHFYLRGIISSSPKGANDSCTFTHYGVYSNVLMYRKWIENPEAEYPDSNLCGLMSSSTGLVQGGKISTREQFPFIAVVVYNSGFNSSAILISHKHVLMHAGGVSSWNEKHGIFVTLTVSTFQIYLGTVSNNIIDEQSIAVSPLKVALHPHLKMKGGTLVNAVAIITLASYVPFNKFISSACLWTFSDDNLDTNKGSAMFGVGYGRDESGKVSNIRKYARMSLIADENTCKEIYLDRSEAFDETKLFCAQGDETSTPCESDTSLVMKFEDKWYIRGVMLTYRKWTSNGTCVYNKPLLY